MNRAGERWAHWGMALDETRIDQLRRILERLHAGEPGERLRQEARAFLASVPQDETVIVQDVLIDAGLTPHELRPPAGLGGDGSESPEALALRLPPSHALTLLMADHERLGGLLSDLEHFNRRLQTLASDSPPEAGVLADLVERFGAFEPHFRCEELALYPALDGADLPDDGLERLVREHQEVREALDQLAELARQIADGQLDRARARVDHVVSLLGPLLRDHIHFENTVLYPLAARTIRSGTWHAIRRSRGPLSRPR